MENRKAQYKMENNELKKKLVLKAYVLLFP